MSHTPTPTDLLENLSLDPRMSPTSEEVRLRAVEVRDVLSSFDRDILPSEFRRELVANLDRPLTLRPQLQTEWTIQQDLEATLLQWGVYDSDAFRLISRLQSPATRTRCFHEKLNRRFEAIFNDYDVLDKSTPHAEEIQEQVDDLARRFTAVVAAVQEDRQYRELGQTRTAAVSLSALIGVCSRQEDVTLASPSSASSQRREKTIATHPSSETSLFQRLVRNAEGERTGGLLMLDLLESYPPSILGALMTNIEELVELLQQHSVPTIYLSRVERLLQRAQDYQDIEAPTVEAASSAGPRDANIEAASAALGADTAGESSRRSGAKRPAGQEPARRGRKKTQK